MGAYLERGYKLMKLKAIHEYINPETWRKITRETILIVGGDNERF